MFKAVFFCVIAILVGTPTVLGNWNVCIKAQQLIWKEDVTYIDFYILTNNFVELFDVVPDQSGAENAFTIQRIRENPVPEVIFDGTVYLLQNVHLYPLDIAKKLAAIQLTFADPTAAKFITFVVPLLEDTKVDLRLQLQRDLQRLVTLTQGKSYETSLGWFYPLVIDLVKIDSAPIDIGLSGKSLVYLTNCQNVKMKALGSIFNQAVPSSIRTAKKTLKNKIASCLGCPW